MFLSKNKKNNVYPCKPQFYYVKVGFNGGQYYIGMFSNVSLYQKLWLTIIVALDRSEYQVNVFSYISTKTYIVGTHDRMSTHNIIMFLRRNKKILVVKKKKKYLELWLLLIYHILCPTLFTQNIGTLTFLSYLS